MSNGGERGKTVLQMEELTVLFSESFINARGKRRSTFRGPLFVTLAGGASFGKREDAKTRRHKAILKKVKNKYNHQLI